LNATVNRPGPCVGRLQHPRGHEAGQVLFHPPALRLIGSSRLRIAHGHPRPPPSEPPLANDTPPSSSPPPGSPGPGPASMGSHATPGNTGHARSLIGSGCLSQKERLPFNESSPAALHALCSERGT
jgi:hypothetical protein